MINACLLQVGDMVRWPEQPDELPPTRIIGIHTDAIEGDHSTILFHGFTIYPQTGEDYAREVTWEVYQERQVDRLTDEEVATLMAEHAARLIQEEALRQFGNMPTGN